LVARHPARWAWRHHHRAWFVAWFGPVFWPYAFADLFDYTFWPWGYYDGYWDYAYDDFYDGIFFPYGAPYASYAYSGPYDGLGAVDTSTSNRPTTSRRSRATTDTVPGEISRSAQQLCAEPGSGVTAWPFDRIEKAIAPTSEQQAMLDELKDAAAKAAARFKEACPSNVPMTPPGRLAAMTGRLQATLDAVKLVRPPLEKFYDSLSDEQKARFNALGPTFVRARDRTAGNDNAQASCSGDRSGLTTFPIARIRDEINPTEDQNRQLDKLSQAMDESVKTLEAACPDYVSRTPVGRLEATQKRLEAMIAAAHIIKPALDDFYASLNDEQKAQFNELGREAANSRE
jgi:hypothetical protein